MSDPLLPSSLYILLVVFGVKSVDMQPSLDMNSHT